MPRSLLGIFLFLFCSVALGESFVQQCQSSFKWLNPAYLLKTRPTKLLQLTSQELKDLRYAAGAPWAKDLSTIARTLFVDHPALLNAFNETIKTSSRPTTWKEVEKITEKVLKREDFSEVRKNLNPEQREILQEAVMTAFESESPTSLEAAFREVVRRTRPLPTGAGQGPLFKGKLNGDPYFMVRWDKRRGDVFKNIEGVFSLQGQFLGYEINPGAGELRESFREGKFTAEDGDYNFVIDLNGEITVAPIRVQYPHPTLLGGRNPKVFGVGEIRVKNGKIIHVNDRSGHFVPDDSLEVIKKYFEKLPKDFFHEDFEGYNQY